MKKSIIDTYKTSIYPVEIVVANEAVTLEELKEQYMYSDEVELDDCIMEGVATTSTAKRKSDGVYVALIKLNHDLPKYKVDNKKAYVINTYTHEAVHAAIDIWDFIGSIVDIRHQEPIAYLAGYISECIYLTHSKK